MKKLFYAAILIVSSAKLNAVFTPPRETRLSFTQSLKVLLKDTLGSLANQEITIETIESLLFNIELFSESSSEEIKEIAAALATISCKDTGLSVEDWLDSSEKEMHYLNDKLKSFLKENGSSDEFSRREILNIVLTEISQKVESEMEVDEDSSSIYNTPQANTNIRNFSPVRRNALAGEIIYPNLEEEDILPASIYDTPQASTNIPNFSPVRRYNEHKECFLEEEESYAVRRLFTILGTRSNSNAPTSKRRKL